ncbi:SHQ1 protein-domain-containing protein [Phlebopus sp. FC_14]|nr:SHQ1 protein-domain-containing protein [Phlebopus sp. FC_14]
MITPRFSCSQTADSVIVSLYCPSVRASDVEISVDDSLLIIHVSPYFLRLSFPHSVVEDDDSSAQYDPSSGYLTVTLSKEVKNQHFADLDLLAKLLAPRPSKPPTAPSIEVIDSQSTTGDIAEISQRIDQLVLEEEGDTLQAANDDWQLPQTVPESLPHLHMSPKKYYGFLNLYTGYFMHVTHTENEVNELGPDVEACDVGDRRLRRIAHENEKWDEEHYMADYADDEHIQELIAWKDPELVSDVAIVYTDAENMDMLRLPRKEYIMIAVQEEELYLTLINLLFAHAYDRRTTLQDPTPESAWTMCTLIPAFSALDPPPYSSAVHDVEKHGGTTFTDAELTSTVVASYRRCLAFPLYRSFQLAERCRKDVALSLSRGKRVVTRRLLEMKRVLDHHEVYYVYSKIWVDDFCVWVQAAASDDLFQQIGDRLEALTVSKAEIGWDLEQLEGAIRHVLDRNPDSDDESAE